MDDLGGVPTCGVCDLDARTDAVVRTIREGFGNFDDCVEVEGAHEPV